MPKNRALCAIAICLPACFGTVVPLAPQAKSVTIVRETDKPVRCEILGKISGRSRSSHVEEAKTGARNDFRNQAAELKGNFALVEAERGGQVGTGAEYDAYVGGKALLCQTEEMEEQQEKEAAAAREAKEKEQAEQAEKEAAEKKAEADAKKAKK
jgi:hypothetical protein